MMQHLLLLARPMTARSRQYAATTHYPIAPDLVGTYLPYLRDPL